MSSMEKDMTKFIVEGLTEIAGTTDGAFCEIKLFDSKGKTLSLVFAADQAANLAQRITTAGQVAAGVAPKMGGTVAALVRDIEVVGSADGSVIGLNLQSGEARSMYALTVDQVEGVSRALKAAMVDAKAKRKRSN